MTMLRSGLERLSRGRTFWRRLPAPFSAARVLVTPDASLSNLKLGTDWVDGELMRMAGSFVKAGDTVWDIGANVGAFGAAAAVKSGRAGHVLCVEADLTLVQLIRKTGNRLPGQCAKLEVLAAAVADAPGIAEFHIAQRGRASNALARFTGRGQMGGVRESQWVPTVTLDQILEMTGKPAFVKIDVEGAEAIIFDGAKRLLNEARPLIYVEVGQPNAQKVAEKLNGASYDLFDPSKEIKGQTPLGTCVWNTLGIPRKV